MHPDIETVRKIPHMGTFEEARRWIASIKDVYGNTNFSMSYDPCGIYIVLHAGALIGKGLTYEQAIQDAERNWKYVSGEITLDGLQCS
jgi:hypothetical protein